MTIIACGEKLTLTLDGIPLDDNETVDAKLPMGVTVSVVVPEYPCLTLIEEGATEIPKSGEGPEEVTVKLNVHSCGVVEPPVDPSSVIE